MQVTINLPPDLEQDLIRQAARSNMPLQTLILQTLRRTTQSTAATSHWSKIVLAYEGMPDFPAFEACRDALLPPREPELF